MLQNKEFHAVIKTKTNTYQWYEKWIKYSYFRPTSSFSRWRQLTTLPRNSCSDFPISMIVHVRVKNMAKYFIFMASIMNTRWILDTCRRKKANSLENLRFLKKTKYVGVSCYTFEKQISIILLNWISYANRTSLYPNLHEKSHLSNFWFWNNYHNRFSMSRSWSMKISKVHCNTFHGCVHLSRCR